MHRKTEHDQVFHPAARDDPKILKDITDAQVCFARVFSRPVSILFMHITIHVIMYSSCS